jgi:Protein of unknown function (DUF2971)
MTIPHDFRSSLVGFSDIEIESLQSGNQYIHRLFPFDRFIDLLRTSSIALMKPKRWDDPYENLMNREVVYRDTGRKFRIPHYDRDLFGQCWSLCCDSDAMWRIYSSDRRGVLVTANAAELFGTMTLQSGHEWDMLFLGKVEYLKEAQLKALFESDSFLRDVLTAEMYSAGSAKTLLYKRDSFEHEKEVRLILSRQVSQISGDMRILSFDIEKTIANVTLDPRLSDADLDRMTFLIRNAGYVGNVERSSLYAMPKLSLSIPSLEWLNRADV